MLQEREALFISKLKLIFTTSCSKDVLDFEQNKRHQSKLAIKSEAEVLLNSLATILDVEEAIESKIVKELFLKKVKTT